MERKKELSLNVTEYLDEVVLDTLIFLNQKMDSKEELETWYSDLEYPQRTAIGKLFDKDQHLWLYGLDFDTDVILLDNNKLLLIDCEGPDYEGSLRTHFWFGMYSNASDYVLRATREGKDSISVELDNGKGNVLKFQKAVSYYPKVLPNEIPITELLRPVSFEQLYERGHIKKKKEKIKKKKKKQD